MYFVGKARAIPLMKLLYYLRNVSSEAIASFRSLMEKIMPSVLGLPTL